MAERIRKDKPQPGRKPAKTKATSDTDPHIEETLDEALRETFPASDAPSVTRYPPAKKK